ncbi:MAG: hypothetical protein E6R04_11355 [Spirochaetes bacterium]|nr:MAG: hypothetical protein E6R04_11355 [Spirochaetota bacterium]
MSEINKGEMSFRHLLNRRRWSVEKWAEAEGIKTRTQFDVAKSHWVATGYFFDEVLAQFRDSLPESLEAPAVVEMVELEQPILVREVETPTEESKPKSRKTKGSGTPST